MSPLPSRKIAEHAAASQRRPYNHVLADSTCTSAYSAQRSWQHTYLENTGAVESSHTWIVRTSGEHIETHWITSGATLRLAGRAFGQQRGSRGIMR